MKTIKVVILTIEDVKKELTAWYADMLINDRSNIIEHIEENGDLTKIMPNIHKCLSAELSEHYTELNLGERHAIANQAELVVIALENYYYEVWNRLPSDLLR